MNFGNNAGTNNLFGGAGQPTGGAAPAPSNNLFGAGSVGSGGANLFANVGSTSSQPNSTGLFTNTNPAQPAGSAAPVSAPAQPAVGGNLFNPPVSNGGNLLGTTGQNIPNPQGSAPFFGGGSSGPATGANLFTTNTAANPAVNPAPNNPPAPLGGALGLGGATSVTSAPTTTSPLTAPNSAGQPASSGTGLFANPSATTTSANIFGGGPTANTGATGGSFGVSGGAATSKPLFGAGGGVANPAPVPATN